MNNKAGVTKNTETNLSNLNQRKISFNHCNEINIDKKYLRSSEKNKKNDMNTLEQTSQLSLLGKEICNKIRESNLKSPVNYKTYVENSFSNVNNDEVNLKCSLNNEKKMIKKKDKDHLNLLANKRKNKLSNKKKSKQTINKVTNYMTGSNKSINNK